MVSATVDLIGPLAVIIVLELAQLARNIPIADPDEGTTRIDYDASGNPVVRGVKWVAGLLSFRQTFASAGGFFVTFAITELVLFGSILAIYGSAGPIVLSDGPAPLTAGGMLVLIAVLWLALPVIVVDRYDDLTGAGIEPFSVDLHVASTVLYLLVAIAQAEVYGRHPLVATFGELPEVLHIHTLLTLVVGVLLGAMSLKSKLFYDFLRAELARIDGTDPDGDPEDVVGKPSGSAADDD